MKLSVKILQGAECNVDIVGADSVDHLKELVKVRKCSTYQCNVGLGVVHFTCFPNKVIWEKFPYFGIFGKSLFFLFFEDS